ncbi:MAG TPA: hypothetical protein VGM88_27925 [Kofleriaceae bacterium]|jgi:hypothetical protein
MAKKKKSKKHPFRNAGPPRAPRAPRAAEQEVETPLKRLAATAGGAAGTALAGSFLAHEGWAPKTIATALAAVGAGLAWKGDAPTIRSVGAGVMSAAGSQLALMVMDDRDKKHAPAPAPQAPQVAKKPANAGNSLPPGALESALERAQTRLALSAREAEA